MRRAAAPPSGSGFSRAGRTRTGQPLDDPVAAADALRVRGTVAGLALYPANPVACACAVIALDAALWAADVAEVDELVRAGEAGRILLAGAVRAACTAELPFPPTLPPAVVDDDWLEWLTAAGEWAELFGIDPEEVLAATGAILALAGGPFADVGALACDLAFAWDTR